MIRNLISPNLPSLATINCAKGITNETSYQRNKSRVKLTVITHRNATIYGVTDKRHNYAKESQEHPIFAQSSSGVFPSEGQQRQQLPAQWSSSRLP